MIKRRRGGGGGGAALFVHSIPKAPRSARKTCSKKYLEDHQLCAFDVLAAVAEKLLQENENSSASSNETDTKDGFLIDRDAMKLDEHLFALSTSESSQNIKADVSPNNNDVGFDTEHKQKVELGGQRTENSSQNNSNIPTQIPEFRHSNSVKFVNRNDNEIYVNFCTKRSKVRRAYRSSPQTGNSGVRKFLGCKYWKASPKLRDHDCCADAGTKHAYHEQEKGLDKKRKLNDHSSVVTSDGRLCSESFSKSDDECAIVDESSTGANEECSSTKNHPVSCHFRDSQVRLSIKSFKVPELLVEVPLTATVGSLKTTVLEAVSSVLRGGLHVEVIVGGKKIKDDTDTLIHSGISHSCDSDSLKFMLEPSSYDSPSPRCENDPLPLLAVNDHKPKSVRYPVEPSPLLSLNSEIKTDHEVALISSDAVQEESQGSKALALFPVTTVEPLSIVPIDQKSKHSELAQRRTRRPFSVSEVEALVQSVEELGTGRWRDVKMRSFVKADHRTYVDLKDKWKTLVHTAQISPQQRRGQPVPQDLLNRVLAAHAYWSKHHQIKQHTRTDFLLAPKDIDS